jgi:choline-sulfatase
VFAGEIGGPLIQDRRAYDEFILNVDSEFNRLYEALERSGVLQDSWLLVTSDHGEMFERGILGHMSHALYEPVLRVPLMIFEPGRQEGAAIRTPTSAIDLLPTLAYVTGHPVPAWCEGAVLPPFGTAADDPNRSVYAVEGMRNHPLAPLTRASAALVRGRHKLHYYFGHQDLGVDELVRMFDLEEDPEELVDLYPVQKKSGDHLLAQLKEQLWLADRPYA